MSERSAPSPRPPPQQVGRGIVALRTGYLMKEGAVVQNWRHRYFVLTGDSLSYFQSADDPLIRSIPLRDILSVGPENYKSMRYGFAVRTTERIFHLTANDEDSLNIWLRALQGALESLP